MNSVPNSGSRDNVAWLEEKSRELDTQIKGNTQKINELTQSVLASEQMKVELSSHVSILGERTQEIQKNISHEREQIKKLATAVKNQQSAKKCLTLFTIVLILAAIGVTIVVLRLKLFRS